MHLQPAYTVQPATIPVCIDHTFNTCSCINFLSSAKSDQTDIIIDTNCLLIALTPHRWCILEGSMASSIGLV